MNYVFCKNTVQGLTAKESEGRDPGGRNTGRDAGRGMGRDPEGRDMGRDMGRDTGRGMRRDASVGGRDAHQQNLIGLDSSEQHCPACHRLTVPTARSQSG